jgi:hypothetical protein
VYKRQSQSRMAGMPVKLFITLPIVSHNLAQD